MEILKVENLTKIYGKGTTKVVALDNVSSLLFCGMKCFFIFRSGLFLLGQSLTFFE